MIITTKRYTFQKTLVQILLFIIQFRMAFGGNSDHIASLHFRMMMIGYAMMCVFYIGRGHGSKVYLRYEAGLGLIIKTITANTVLFFFICAIGEMRILIVLEKMIWLTILNIATIILINMFGNVVLKQQMKTGEKVLYIYDDVKNLRFPIGSREGTWISIEETDEIIINEIEKSDIVYLIDISSKQRNHLLKVCYERDKYVFITTKLSDILIKTSGITQDGDTPVYYCNRFGISKASSVLKRCFDIVCSSVALIVLAPIFLIVAILIKLEDGGPVIYSQIRCTIRQKEFKIYKFRSLKCDSEKNGAQLTLDDDDRVTRIGKLIRYTKIDELPQLVNILKGEMSIVGPRPERPEMIRNAIQDVPEFALRMKVKAGLTGYAQVRGYYNTDFLDKLKWDLMYIENYSFLLDIKIIIMTLFVIFQNNIRKGVESNDKPKDNYEGVWREKDIHP